MVGIYSITNVENNKMYIGQSSDIEWRWKHHVSDLKHNRHHNRHLQSSWNKYGENVFVFNVIEECETKDLDTREIYWIETYDTYNLGYNLDKGGQGIRGYKHTEEEILKMIQIQKPKPVLQLDNDLNVIERWLSASQAAKRLGCNARTIKACCERRNHQKTVKGCFWAYEEDYNSEDFDTDYFIINASQPKPILQFDLDMNFIKEWESISSIERAGVTKVASVVHVCKGKRKTAGGFVWRYKEDYSEEKYLKDKEFDYHTLNINKEKRAIAQTTLTGKIVKVFPSITEAARETGFSRSGIQACCSGRQKTSHDYIWKYVD